MSEDEAIELLRAECQKAGSQKAWAIAHCISPAYVCDVLSKRRAIGVGLANALDLERILTFQRRGNWLDRTLQETSATVAGWSPEKRKALKQQITPPQPAPDRDEP